MRVGAADTRAQIAAFVYAVRALVHAGIRWAGELVLAYSGHGEFVNTVAWSSDGKYLASGSGNATPNPQRVPIAVSASGIPPPVPRQQPIKAIVTA